MQSRSNPTIAQCHSEKAVIPARGRDLKREFYSEQLRNLDAPINEEEAAFVKNCSAILPEGRWAKWLLSWGRALQSYGTPLNFCDGAENEISTFREGGMQWNSFTRKGGNYQLRRELMARQKPYIGQIPAHELPFRFAPECLLCQNVHQGVDAARLPSIVPNNVMIDFANAFLLPNRYPSVPLSSLWIPKAHDDLSRRILPDPREDGFKARLGPVEGKTREALVCADELKELFNFADVVGFLAIRNHRLSGKSIHYHDHWQLFPLEHYPIGWFSSFVGNVDAGISRVRARGTPYDVMVFKGMSVDELAEETAKLLNNLERKNGIFSPYFVPNPDGGLTLIAPLKEGSSDTFVQIGGGVQVHERGTEEAAARYDRYVPKRGSFDWQRFGVDCVETTDIEYSTEKIFALYKPIDYRRLRNWGTGGPVGERMSSTERTVYGALFTRQDQRGDFGHTDTVIYFTEQLAALMQLSPVETEAVKLAAIFHDAGWSLTPQIEAIWHELATRRKGSDLADATQAALEMAKLRLAHEQEAARLVREIIPNHPLAEEIAAAVLDHDTRSKAPTAPFRAFLDADWLWRVTATSRFAKTSGAYDRNDPELVYSMLQREFSPADFFLPYSYQIARIEVANTMTYLKDKLGWGKLPDSFLVEYSKELAALPRAL